MLAKCYEEEANFQHFTLSNFDSACSLRRQDDQFLALDFKKSLAAAATKVSGNHDIDNIRFNLPADQPQILKKYACKYAEIQLEELFTQTFQAICLNSMASTFNTTLPKVSTSVLYVKGFEYPNYSAEHINSLFQCFGHVHMTMLHTSKNYALVKFDNVESAKMALKVLYGKEIKGNKLLIHFSQFDQLRTKIFSNDKIYFESDHISRGSLPVIKAPPFLSRYLDLHLLGVGMSSEESIPTATIVRASLSQVTGLVEIIQGTNPLCYSLHFETIKLALDFVLENNCKLLPNTNFKTIYTFSHRSRF